MSRRPTIGSLFSGAGGLELGLELCGWGPVVWQCETDPAARAVLEAHWPGVKRYHDVRTIDARAARPTLICGGFPCQPVSQAGKRKAQRDPRWLWPYFAAVIATLRPPLVFVENVPALRASGLREVLCDLASLGLDAVWDMFEAAEVGAPHTRRRLFLVAYAPGPGLEVLLAQPPRREGPPALRGNRSPHSWATEPDVVRVAHGVPARVDRLRILGNSCVPQCAALAFTALLARIPAVPRPVRASAPPPTAAPPPSPPR